VRTELFGAGIRIVALSAAVLCQVPSVQAQTADGPEAIWQQVPLPKVRPGATVKLRVAHVVNPRMAKLDAGQLRHLLDVTVTEARRQFGVVLEFRRVETVGVADLFDRLEPAWRERLAPSIVDFKSGIENIDPELRQSLNDGFLETFAANPARAEAIIAFAHPYLEEPPQQGGLPALAAALTGTMLSRLDHWRTLEARDGRPLIDNTPYNEWVYWDALGYTRLPWDLVVTNQPVISAETYGADVHTALRGGITTGTTSHNIGSDLGAWAWISTFPFRHGDPMLTRLRGDKTYGPDQATTLAGAYFAHEIGHLLFHLGHPFDRPACAMAPARLLDFAEWLDGLDPLACPLGSDPTMVPGAVSLDYRPDLIQAP